VKTMLNRQVSRVVENLKRSGALLLEVAAFEPHIVVLWAIEPRYLTN
jgi:hypothetical protein